MVAHESLCRYTTHFTIWPGRACVRLSATATCLGERARRGIGDDARVAKTGHVSGATIETQSPAVGK
jgi:hypothetical protein